MKLSSEEIAETILGSKTSPGHDTIRVIRHTKYNQEPMYTALCGKHTFTHANLIEAIWRCAEWLCEDGYDLRDITLEPELLEEEEFYQAVPPELFTHDRASAPPEQRFVSNLDLVNFHDIANCRFFHGAPSPDKLLSLYRLLYVIVTVAPAQLVKEFSAPVLAEIKKLEREAGHRRPPPW